MKNIINSVIVFAVVLLSSQFVRKRHAEHHYLLKS
jgi:hypothetical protein